MGGTINPQIVATGQNIPRGGQGSIRGDGSGAQVVTLSGMGRFGEAALKAQIFHGVSVTLTLAASGGNLVASTAGQNTNTCLFNPSTSTNHLVLLRVSVSVNSGTFAAGGVYHGLASGQTIATSISGAAKGTNGFAGSNTTAQGWVFTQGTQAALTGGAAPVQLGPISGTTATAAANGYLLQVVDEVDGAIVLPPGGQYQPLWTGVGTTVIYNVGYTWAEIDSRFI